MSGLTGEQEKDRFHWCLLLAPTLLRRGGNAQTRGLNNRPVRNLIFCVHLDCLNNECHNLLEHLWDVGTLRHVKIMTVVTRWRCAEWVRWGTSSLAWLHKELLPEQTSKQHSKQRWLNITSYNLSIFTTLHNRGLNP